METVALYLEDRMICPAEQMVGISKGVCPLGRGAWVHTQPEKGRQWAEASVGRGKPVSPSKVIL